MFGSGDGEVVGLILTTAKFFRGKQEFRFGFVFELLEE